MELYCRVVNIFDEEIMNHFAKDHVDNNTMILAGDCSLILGKSYHEYDNFYDWYKLVNKLDKEELEDGQVGCTVYLVFRKRDDKLIGIFDIRHSLNFVNGDIYGHIGVDICPSERGKGYYVHILELILEEIKKYSINPVIISCEYDNIASKRGIDHFFSNEEMIPFNGSYLFVYKKEIDGD